MRSNQGFTIIEIVVVVAILSITSFYAIFSFKKAIATNQLQKAAWDVMKELSSVRPLALKNDCKVIVKFSAASCSVFVDKNGDVLTQPDEFQEAWDAKAGITFKLPTKLPPSTAPSGVSLPASGEGVSGQWSSNLIFNNDALGRMNSGSVFLSSVNVDKVTYCITSVNSQTLKIYSWNGTSWTAL